MELLKVQIKNWQTFSNISLECKEFLVFIGESSTGKSSFMKALLYFFQARNLHKGDIKNPELPLEIIGTLKGEKGHIFQLRILNNPYQDTRYFIKNHISKHEKDNRNWEEIDEKEYKKHIFGVSVFYVPSYMKISHLNFLVERLFRNENLRRYHKYYRRFKNSMNKKMSFGFYRHLFIELLNEIIEKEKDHNFCNNTILLWEEPEFYLNPQQERACYEALSESTKLGLMSVVSTNSSRFIEIENYQSLCIFRRVKEEIEIYQYSRNLFSGDEVTVFNMNYWINPDRSELFFAKKVILVEGQTDKIVLSYLAKHLGVFKYEYSIIECGSKSSIPQFIRLLNAFHIPYVAVYDKDNHYWRNETELMNSTLKNKTIQKLVSKNLGTWIEFENDIEEVKKNRKYFDNYIDNVFQDEEKYVLNISYYEKIGDKEKAKKYFDEFVKKYANKWTGKIILAGYESDTEKAKKYIKEGIELLKRDIKNGNKDEVTDEEFFAIQNVYDNIMIQEILEKNQYQKVIDYYLDNMANQNYYTTGVMMKYGDRLTSQFYIITNLNEKFLNKNKENLKKITNTKLYRELEKFGKVIVVNK